VAVFQRPGATEATSLGQVTFAPLQELELQARTSMDFLS